MPTSIVAMNGLMVVPPKRMMATITNIALSCVASERWIVSRMERLTTIS